MKKLLLIFFAFAFLAAKAQTVDEIIQLHANAMGGLENFNKLQSLKITGTMTSMGTEMAITVQIINNKAMRTDIDVMGQKIVSCYNNGKGWTINPFAGKPTATDVTGTDLAEYKSQAMLASQLMDYKARGHQVELLGKENVDGASAYKIKLVNNETGKITNYFIDSTTSLLIRSVGNIELQGMEMEMETTFSDLMNIGELKYNMTRTQTIQGQPFREIKYKIVELNVPIDEKIFEKQ